MTQHRPMRTLWAICTQIVDLRVLADHGVGQRAAVDGGVGADLHIVLDDDAPDLRDLFRSLIAENIAEAVLADAGAAVDEDAIADERVQDAGAGADEAVAADPAAGADDGVGRDYGSAADGGAAADRPRPASTVAPGSSVASPAIWACGEIPGSPATGVGATACG